MVIVLKLKEVNFEYGVIVFSKRKERITTQIAKGCTPHLGGVRR
jgi:hypothetical protein